MVGQGIHSSGVGQGIHSSGVGQGIHSSGVGQGIHTLMQRRSLLWPGRDFPWWGAEVAEVEVEGINNGIEAAEAEVE